MNISRALPFSYPLNWQQDLHSIPPHTTSSPSSMLCSMQPYSGDYLVKGSANTNGPEYYQVPSPRQLKEICCLQLEPSELRHFVTRIRWASHSTTWQITFNPFSAWWRLCVWKSSMSLKTRVWASLSVPSPTRALKRYWSTIMELFNLWTKPPYQRFC